MKRSYCVDLLRKTKKDHYVNFDEKLVVGDKYFWRTVKSLLPDKIKSSEKVALVEGEKL